MADAESKDVVLLQRAIDLILMLNTPKGRGVFTKRFIEAGEVIDISPVLVLSHQDNRQHIEKTELYHYTYNWPTVNNDNSIMETRQAVVFGLGSMFNHSRDQNIGWKRDLDKLTITYYALRAIPAGEELCISYGARLTFPDADGNENPSSPECDGVQLMSQIDID